MQTLNRWEGVGCSDLPAIMKTSPYKTPYQLWEQKVYRLDDSADNPNTRYGKKMEPIIREKVEKKLGMDFEPIKLTSRDKPWFWASLDGYNEGTRIAIEIKTANKDDHVALIGGKIPDKYYPQVQGQHSFQGVDRLFYCSYYEDDLEIVEIPQNPDYCSKMLEEMDKFWQMVLTKTPPELTERDYVDMSGSKEYGKAAKSLKGIKEEIKTLEDREKELLECLKALSQERNSKGFGLTLQKQVCKGAVDYGKIPELQGIDLEPYRKKSFDKWTARYNGDR